MARIINENENAGVYENRINNNSDIRPVIPKPVIPRTPVRTSAPSPFVYTKREINTSPNFGVSVEQSVVKIGRVVDYIADIVRQRGLADIPLESSDYPEVVGSRIKDPINRRVIVDSDVDVMDDLIPFYIRDTTNSKLLQFRATVKNINMSSNSNWNTDEFIGRPYASYTYTGVARELSFDFEVYAIGEGDVNNVWEKINYLEGLTHPASYIQNGNHQFMTPPYVEMTIGDLFVDVPGFFRTVVVTINDAYPWSTARRFDRNSNTTLDVNEMKVPYFAIVNVSYQIIEKDLHRTGSDLHGWRPKQSSVQSLANQRFMEETGLPFGG